MIGVFPEMLAVMFSVVHRTIATWGGAYYSCDQPLGVLVHSSQNLLEGIYT